MGDSWWWSGRPGGFWGSEDISESLKIFRTHQGHSEGFGGGLLRFGGSEWKIPRATSGMGVGGRENSWDV